MIRFEIKILRKFILKLSDDNKWIDFTLKCANYS